MLVSELLVQARAILNDADSVAYTEPELLNGINLACQAVSIHRPDASTVTGGVDLVVGTRQALPQGGLRVLEAFGNVGGGVTRMVNRADLDAADPLWPQADIAATVIEVMVDERSPGVFYVSPPNDGNGQLNMMYTVVPAGVVSDTEELPVTDKYGPPILEWLLYLMFSRDSERSPNQARAKEHYQAFFALLGIKTQMDTAFSPKNQRH